MSVVKEIFLSHAHQDKELTDRLASLLRAHGLPVWYSPTEMIGAVEWHDEIGKALVRCDWFIVLVSQSSVGSLWVKRELTFALRDPRYNGRIVPVLADDSDLQQLSWVLPGMQCVDLSRGCEEGARDLLRIWGLGYRD